MPVAKKTTTAKRGPSAEQRTQRDAAPEMRGERGVTEDAQRTGDDGLSSSELEKLIRDEFDQNSLPKPPAIPGQHLCWLTTTSGFDTISKRRRIGYVAVRQSELPDFDPSNGQKLASYEGFVTCNEMVLHRIPERVYQMYMKIYHHQKPLEDEQNIVSKAKDNPTGDSKGRLADTEEVLEGVSEMERTVKRVANLTPSFND